MLLRGGPPFAAVEMGRAGLGSGHVTSKTAVSHPRGQVEGAAG